MSRAGVREHMDCCTSTDSACQWTSLFPVYSLEPWLTVREVHDLVPGRCIPALPKMSEGVAHVDVCSRRGRLAPPKRTPPPAVTSMGPRDCGLAHSGQARQGSGGCHGSSVATRSPARGIPRSWERADRPPSRKHNITRRSRLLFLRRFYSETRAAAT